MQEALTRLMDVEGNQKVRVLAVKHVPLPGPALDAVVDRTHDDAAPVSARRSALCLARRPLPPLVLGSVGAGSFILAWPV